MGVLGQFRLLLWKNLCVMRRSKLWTAAEIVCPFLVLGFLYLVFSSDGSDKSPHDAARTYESKTLQGIAKENRCNSRLLFMSPKTILYSHDASISAAAQALMKKLLVAEDITIENASSLKELAKKLDDDWLDAEHKKMPSYFCGVHFDQVDVASKQLSYTLHWPTDYAWSRNANNEIAPHTRNDHPNFVCSGLVNIQLAIDNAFGKILSSDTVDDDLSIRQLPDHPVDTRVILDVLHFVHFVYFMMMIVIILQVAREVAAEKESGMKDFLMVMGMGRGVFFSSHIFMSFIKSLPSLLAGAIPVLMFVENVSGVLLIVSLLGFGIALISISTIVGALTSKPSTATTVLILLVVGMNTMTYFFKDREKVFLCYLLSLNPMCALSYTILQMVENLKTKQSLTLWNSFEGGTYAFPAGGAVLMLAIDAVLYLFLCIFIDWFTTSPDSPLMKWHAAYLNKSNTQARTRNEIGDAIEMDDFLRKGGIADIELNGVAKQWSEGNRAVDGLNMKCYRGQVTVLLGHNGAGKSTTFNMVSGLTRPTSGEVRIKGMDITENLAACQKAIGYCPQANAIFPKLTVYQHLKFFAKLRDVETAAWKKERRELCALLKLDTHKNHLSASLSGGMKRKLCVGMAMIGGNKVVLLDEPTAGMDPGARRDIEHMLAKEKGQRTILLTTHYMDEAELLGDRIVIMAAGKVLCSGTPQFLKKRFGMGYILTLAMSPSNVERAAKKVKHIVDKHVYGAEISDIHGQQVELHIPKEQCTRFPEMFSELEAHKGEIGIVSFGLSLNNLEQVFLKVGELSDPHGKRELEESLRCALREIVDHRKGKSAVYSPTEALPHQFLALIKKRFYYMYRHPFEVVGQFLLPLLIIFGAKLIYDSIGGILADMTVSVNVAQPGIVRMAIFDDNIPSYTAETSKLLKKYSNVMPVHAKGADVNQYLLSQKPSRPMFIGGISMEGKQLEVMYSTIYYFGLPEMINFVDSMRFGASIATTFKEYGREQSHYKIAKAMMSSIFQKIVIGPLLLLVFVILVGPFVNFPIIDRTSNFSHQQRLTGISPFLYWSTNLCIDFGLFTIGTMIFYCAMVAFSMIHAACFFSFFTIAYCYFGAIIFLIYTMSCFINSPTKAKVFLLFLQIVVALSIFTVSAMASWDLIKMSKSTLNSFRAAASFFLPPVGLTFAFLFLGMGELVQFMADNGLPVQRMLDGISESKGGKQDRVFFFDPTHSVMHWTNAGFQCFLMAMFGLIFAAIFVALQFRTVQRIFYRVQLKLRLALFPIPDAVPLKGAPPVHDNYGGLNDALDVHGLSKWYGRQCAVDNLSFNVHKRECFGLLGVNGAGKTSTFNIITGQAFATKGTASVGGVDVAENVAIGYCPQFDALLPDLSGRQCLEILAALHGYKEVTKKVNAVLRVVDMHQHADKKVSQCSGGQRRKISVAVAILAHKSLIILDEPTAGIDPSARREIWQLLMSVRDETDTALLLTSHSMDECEALCSRIGVLRRGRLIALGTSQTLKTQFGRSYTFTIVIGEEADTEKILNATQAVFPGATLCSGEGTQTLVFMVPRRKSDEWSTMFAQAIAVAARVSAADFCLSQASLEQAFLMLSYAHDDELTRNSIASTATVSSTNTVCL